MPKIITSRRLEGESERAREYVRTHIVLPSSVLGLLFMVMLFGWAQTRYHQYLLRAFPGNLAGRLRVFTKNRAKRPRKEVTIPPIEHPRRNLVPFGYAFGAVALFAAAAWSSTFGQTYYVAAF